VGETAFGTSAGWSGVAAIALTLSNDGRPVIYDRPAERPQCAS
jgi:hypothetical protein